jgi:hypothetical protein
MSILEPQCTGACRRGGRRLAGWLPRCFPLSSSPSCLVRPTLEKWAADKAQNPHQSASQNSHSASPIQGFRQGALQRSRALRADFLAKMGSFGISASLVRGAPACAVPITAAPSSSASSRCSSFTRRADGVTPAACRPGQGPALDIEPAMDGLQFCSTRPQTTQIATLWNAYATAVVGGSCAGVGRADGCVGFSCEARGAPRGAGAVDQRAAPMDPCGGLGRDKSRFGAVRLVADLVWGEVLFGEPWPPGLGDSPWQTSYNPLVHTFLTGVASPWMDSNGWCGCCLFSNKLLMLPNITIKFTKC